MNVTLTVTAGPHTGREFVFDRHDTFLVGRTKDAHFQLSYDDPYFSRRHFLVEVNPPRLRVYDLDSRNGVAVNGQSVSVAELKDGDELKAGHTVFRVSVPPADPDEYPTLAYEPAKATPRPPGVTAEFLPALPGYVLEGELGRGGMGVVYRATRAADGRPVAVKVIRPAEGTPHREAQRFLREARIMTALEHRNIVRCFDCGEADGRLFLAMELATGPDLRRRVKDDGAMDVPKAVRLVLHALDGLAHAHANGFVHRDVKPGNLVLDGPKTGRIVKVADFGLARAFNECGLSGVTMQGEVGGTPAFMAPEQVTHFREVKPAADQYSAAATLYYLLTSQFVLDFRADPAAQMVQIVTAARVPVRHRRQAVPADLAAVIEKGLSLEPEKRYPTTTALRAALRPFA